MQNVDIIQPLVTTSITALSIIVIWLLQFAVKKLMKDKDKKNEYTLADITNFVIEAERKLGHGQGNAKMLYVLQKLGKTEKDKKTIKKINETHAILNTAKDTLTTKDTAQNEN